MFENSLTANIGTLQFGYLVNPILAANICLTAKVAPCG